MRLGEIISLCGITFNAIGYWYDPKSRFFEVSTEKEFLAAYQKYFRKNLLSQRKKSDLILCNTTWSVHIMPG